MRLQNGLQKYRMYELPPCRDLQRVNQEALFPRPQRQIATRARSPLRCYNTHALSETYRTPKCDSLNLLRPTISYIHTYIYTTTTPHSVNFASGVARNTPPSLPLLDQETNIIRGVRSWQAEFTKPYNRGLLIDCEGGDTIIARTDTSAEQEEWTEALGTVSALLGNSTGVGFGGGESDEESEDGDDEGGMIQTTYLKQKDALLSAEEATGACTVVFQVGRSGGGDGVGRIGAGCVLIRNMKTWYVPT